MGAPVSDVQICYGEFAMSPLITAHALAQQLDANTVVLDCRFDLADSAAGFARYQDGHIPGACYAHLDRDLSSPITPDSGRHPLPAPQALAERLGQWGIGPTTSVVCYDDAGGAFAARAWWLLRWLGHDAVSVLDGGWAAWCDNGYAVETGSKTKPSDTGYSIDLKPLMVSSDEVLANIDQPRFLLIDARAANRFAGNDEPIDPIAGHVPGAMNRPFTDNLAGNGCFKSSAELQQEWSALLQGQPCVAMCGSGVTACHHLLALEVAGLPAGRLYPGSWSEWIRDPTRPVAQGA